MSRPIVETNLLVPSAEASFHIEARRQRLAPMTSVDDFKEYIQFEIFGRGMTPDLALDDLFNELKNMATEIFHYKPESIVITNDNYTSFTRFRATAKGYRRPYAI